MNESQRAGATGSGKSTSLAVMINHRNRCSAGHIVTVEDPVEFVHQSQQPHYQLLHGGSPQAVADGPLQQPARDHLAAAIGNADSANELRLNIKLNSKRGAPAAALQVAAG
jgi:Tfp pilus assembly ATPase PilU